MLDITHLTQHHDRGIMASCERTNDDMGERVCLNQKSLEDRIDNLGQQASGYTGSQQHESDCAVLVELEGRNAKH